MEQGEEFADIEARVRTFTNEIRRYLYIRCVEDTVSVAMVESFIHDLYAAMIRRPRDCTQERLCGYLASTAFYKVIWKRYKKISMGY